MNNKNEFLIDEEMVRGEGETQLGRELTEEEIEQVFEALSESWVDFVQEKVSYVADFNEMLNRNKGAKNEPIHFDAYHRNKNAYQLDFELAGSFKTEADAKEYARHDFITEFDEWKIVRVFGNDEMIIWAINYR